MIQVLHSSAIDKNKWDAAVCNNGNARIYSMSWFLDAVTQNNWNAVVLNDYVEVLPFVSGKKFGIRYCYMPYFAQQFSVNESSASLPLLFQELRKHYAYGQLAINKNSQELVADSQDRNNFELVLDKNYDSIRQSFSSNHKTNINRFKKSSSEIKRSDDLSSLLTLLADEKSSVFHAKELNGILHNITTIYKAAAVKGLSRLYYAHDADGIAGGAFFVEEGNRLYYLLGIAKRKPKHSQSISYGLLDHVIQKYSGQSVVLDFEGSQIESISYFFKGFGATNHPYSVVKWNDLPFWIKWIKR